MSAICNDGTELGTNVSAPLDTWLTIHALAKEILSPKVEYHESQLDMAHRALAVTQTNARAIIELIPQVVRSEARKTEEM